MEQMKLLHLLRHAKSSWDDPNLRDAERPLAPRGRKATKRMAAHLRRQKIRPELVLCSTALRARETLEGIRPALAGVPARFEEGLYGAGAQELLDRLHALDDAVGSVMMIGHNPGLQDLALLLAGEGADLPRLREKFPTGALATFEVETWWGLGPGSARLQALVVPRELR